jgi:2-haloacid dehalogenase
LFDLDGTLLDYDAAESAALDATLRGAGLATSDDVRAAYRRINAAHWQRLEEGRTTPDRLRVERWRELLVDHDLSHVDAGGVADDYIGHLANGAHLLDGALDVLDDLGRDHRIAFVTNGLADVQRPRLGAAGLLDRAEIVVISDEVGVAKPDAGIFDLAVDLMGEPPRREILMIGDSLSSDIAGGAAAGMDTAWVNPDRRPAVEVQPTFDIRSVTELPALLRR